MEIVFCSVETPKRSTKFVIFKNRQEMFLLTLFSVLINEISNKMFDKICEIFFKNCYDEVLLHLSEKKNDDIFVCLDRRVYLFAQVLTFSSK
jgi:hypothetical protein